MNAWKAEILKIIRLLAGNPESFAELVTLLMLAVITCVMVLCKVGNAMKFSMANMKRSAAILAIGFTAIMLAVAAVTLYLTPHLANENFRRWAPIMAAVVTCMVIVVPSICLLYHAPYFKALFTALLSIAAAGAVILLVQAGFNAVRRGEKDFDKRRDRMEDIDKILGK